ncbi:hypothetical protein HK405_008879, partial [Cladochytrium tenue]
MPATPNPFSVTAAATTTAPERAPVAAAPFACSYSSSSSSPSSATSAESRIDRLLTELAAEACTVHTIDAANPPVADAVAVAVVDHRFRIPPYLPPLVRVDTGGRDDREHGLQSVADRDAARRLLFAAFADTWGVVADLPPSSPVADDGHSNDHDVWLTPKFGPHPYSSTPQLLAPPRDGWAHTLRRAPSAPGVSRIDESAATGSSGFSCGELDLRAGAVEALRTRQRATVLGSGGGRGGADGSNTAPPWKKPAAQTVRRLRSQTLLSQHAAFAAVDGAAAQAQPQESLLGPRARSASGPSRVSAGTVAADAAAATATQSLRLTNDHRLNPRQHHYLEDAGGLAVPRRGALLPQAAGCSALQHDGNFGDAGTALAGGGGVGSGVWAPRRSRLVPRDEVLVWSQRASSALSRRAAHSKADRLPNGRPVRPPPDRPTLATTMPDPFNANARDAAAAADAASLSSGGPPEERSSFTPRHPSRAAPLPTPVSLRPLSPPGTSSAGAALDAAVSSPSRSRLFFKSIFSPRTSSSSSSSSSSSGSLASPPLSASPRSRSMSGSSPILPSPDPRLTRRTTVGSAGSADDLGRPPRERSVSGGSSLGPSELTLQEESPQFNHPWRVRIPPPPMDVIDVDYKTLSPSDAASHLFNGTIARISRDEVCNIIGKRDEFHHLILEHYMAHFDFLYVGVDVALRQFTNHLHVTGETQAIDRILSQLAKRFWDCNPDAHQIYRSADFRVSDVVHGIMFSVVLLNTDLHVANVGQNVSRRMTKRAFVRNTFELIEQMVAQDDAVSRQLSSIQKEYQKSWRRDMELQLERLYKSIRDRQIAIQTPMSKSFDTGPSSATSEDDHQRQSRSTSGANGSESRRPSNSRSNASSDIPSAAQLSIAARLAIPNGTPPVPSIPSAPRNSSSPPASSRGSMSSWSNSPGPLSTGEGANGAPTTASPGTTQASKPRGSYSGSDRSRGSGRRGLGHFKDADRGVVMDGLLIRKHLVDRPGIRARSRKWIKVWCILTVEEERGVRLAMFPIDSGLSDEEEVTFDEKEMALS